MTRRTRISVLEDSPEIEEIEFARHNNKDYASFLSIKTSSICLRNPSGIVEYSVRKKDIPNLIKALQKVLVL